MIGKQNYDKFFGPKKKLIVKQVTTFCHKNDMAQPIFHELSHVVNSIKLLIITIIIIQLNSLLVSFYFPVARYVW
jgi:hypothetical protein